MKTFLLNAIKSLIPPLALSLTAVLAVMPAVGIAGEMPTTKLIEASKMGAFAEVKACLAERMDVNARDQLGPLSRGILVW